MVLLETYSRIDTIDKLVFVDDFGKPIPKEFGNLMDTFKVEKVKSRETINLILMFFKVWKIAKDYDLIYNFSDYPPALYFSYWISKLTHKPMVFRVHNYP
ncbi:MAG: hypothetical protein QW478_12965 [Candidatus Micrarchaeaceae archaeon]